jgi:hypothetical protein
MTIVFTRGLQKALCEDLCNIIIKSRLIPPVKIPWRLVYVEEMNSKREALIREKNLKKATIERIRALIDHPKI